MKFGIRKPSLKKSLAARISIKKRIMPRMPRGYGFLRNPKKAMYNKVYNRTSVSAVRVIKALTSSSKKSGGCMVFMVVFTILLIISFLIIL